MPAKSDKKNRPVTQKDVAKRAGVSPSIVSYTINGGPRSVSEETRQRVLAAIEELGYRPNKHAQMLMREKWGSTQLKQFGIILGHGFEMLERPFYGAVLAGIYKEAHARGMRIRFIQFLEELRDPVLFNELVHPDEISGLLFLSIDEDIHSDPDRKMLERTIDRIPNVVCMERQWGNLPSVVFEKRDGAVKAISHLIKLGHRRIGYVGRPDARLKGYQQALFNNEIPFDSDLIDDSALVNSTAEGYAGFLQLMQIEYPPTAVFAVSDEVAIGVIRGAKDCNLRIPEDVALVSFDDIAVAPFLHPALTTIRNPKRRMGSHAVRMLVDRFENPESPPAVVLLPTKLVIRESCGARTGYNPNEEQTAAIE